MVMYDYDAITGYVTYDFNIGGYVIKVEFPRPVKSLAFDLKMAREFLSQLMAHVQILESIGNEV